MQVRGYSLKGEMGGQKYGFGGKETRQSRKRANSSEWSAPRTQAGSITKAVEELDDIGMLAGGKNLAF